MKTIAYLLLIFAVSCLMACGGQSQGEGKHSHGEGTHSHGDSHDHADHDHADHDHGEKSDGLETNEVGGYGDVVTQANALNIDEVVSKVTDAQPMKAKVKATVSEVCQKKGCWMTLNRADGKTMRVTFKDYGFFVPKDISGKEVIIEGVAKVEMTDVATLKHFAEDAGKSKEEIAAITAPEAEVVFEADGVIIL